MEHHKSARDGEVGRVEGKRRYFCSWSGGKDSCLALYYASRTHQPERLFTMLVEDGSRSRGHALPLDVIRLQADSIGVPLMTRCASWEEYEGAFVDGLRELAEDDIDCGVFGDIDLEGHREWAERVCSSVGIDAYEPLWKRNRVALLDEFFALGFKATIVAVRDGVLPADLLGDVLSPGAVADMEKLGTDASGERGEYHTVVTDGPVFSRPITVYPGDIVSRDGYHFLSVSSKP